MIYAIIAVAVMVVMSVITFALYSADKRRAQKNLWRIKESTLILCGFLMGGLGAMLGMSMLRHKTKHIKFKLLVPIALLFNIVVIVAVLYFADVLPWGS